MTSRELRKMNRADLIEIIYQYQKKEQELLQENAELRQQLEDRQIQMKNAGSIAEAALALNEVFEAAQSAADQYLQSVKHVCCQSICDSIDTSGREGKRVRKIKRNHTIEQKRPINTDPHKYDTLTGWWKKE